jgi:hypothetical protein
MTLRTGHGNGRGQPRIEVLPVDELPAPVAAPLPVPAAPVHRRQDGKLADAASAAELGRRGGEAKARRVRLVDSLGLSKLVEQTTFGPYRAAAEEFVSHHRASLAEQAGGELGPAPSTMVASAGLQLAASRWAFDQGAAANDASLIKLGSSLANDSRQNLLAAYELAVREAQARQARRPDAAAQARAMLDAGARRERP